MSDAPQGPGWWQASDGKWYAPELHPDATAVQQPPAEPPNAPQPPAAPPSEPPAAPPTAQQPPAGPPPYGAPPAGPPPAGSPPPGATPPFGATPDGTAIQPAAASTPPGPAPEEGSGKGRVALVVAALVLVALIGAGIAYAVTSGGDDDETAEPATTTSTAVEDRDPPVSRTLLPRSTTTLGDDGPTSTIPLDDLGVLPGLDEDLDPEVVLCVGTAVSEDPALADVASSPDFDPADPAVAALFQVLVDCGARSYLEEAFVAELDAEQSTCVSEVFATMDDETFIGVVLGLAQEDLTAAEPLVPCLI